MPSLDGIDPNLTKFNYRFLILEPTRAASRSYLLLHSCTRSNINIPSIITLFNAPLSSPRRYSPSRLHLLPLPLPYVIFIIESHPPKVPSSLELFYGLSSRLLNMTIIFCIITRYPVQSSSALAPLPTHLITPYYSLYHIFFVTAWTSGPHPNAYFQDLDRSHDVVLSARPQQYKWQPILLHGDYVV